MGDHATVMVNDHEQNWKDQGDIEPARNANFNSLVNTDRT